METEAFGVRLRRLRESKKIGLRELARQVGIGASTLHHWESGRRWEGKAPPADDVKKIAVVLGVSVAELLGEPPGEVAPQPPPRPSRLPDGKFDPRAIVEYVEAWPDPIFHERLMRQKEARTAQSYEWFCLTTFRLWTANFDGALRISEEFQGEVWGAEPEEDETGQDVSDADSAIGK